MSFAAVNEAAQEIPVTQGHVASVEEPVKMRYKSFKKKFLKLRHHFKDQMRENTKLYEDQQHATRIAQRLQEQNDQLLDLLLDVNDKAKLPSYLRYDLRSPTPNASDVPGLEPDIALSEHHEVEGARAALREARAEYEAGQISLPEYKDTEASLMTIINAPRTSDPPKNLAELSKVSHTELTSVPPSGMPRDLIDDAPTGYLSPAHEEEFLTTLDNYIANAPSDSQLILPRPKKPNEKEREREAQLHNPVSVYNWLRAHSDPKPLTHDLEKDTVASHSNTSEPSAPKTKPSPKPPSSTSNTSTKPSRKRASSALMAKQEPEEELLDDEGFVIGGGSEVPMAKGKRKRDGDNAYRPKGGSSKSRKRTKGSGGAAVRQLEPEVEEEEVDNMEP